jgi:hypothetical protein
LATEILENPIEIFYPGNHIDSQGTSVKVTPAQVAAMVADFNASGRKVPLVPGHPGDDLPALGYAVRLELTNGRATIAAVEDLDPAFKSIVNSGELDRVSVKLLLPGNPQNSSKGYALKHVGFLGRSRPALDKLKFAQFSKQDGEIVLMPDEHDEAAFAAKEAEFTRKEQELAAREAAFNKARIYEPFLEELVREGKLTPAQKQPFTALFSSLPDGEVEFAAGETKQSTAEFLKGFLNGLPVEVVYGEVSKAKGQTATTASFKAMGKDCNTDSEEMEMHDEIVAAGVDVKDPVAYAAAVKKQMQKGGK